MSGVYDNWGRLVGAVLEREELRRLALCESLSSSTTSDFRSRFSFASSTEDVDASRIFRKTFDPAASSSQSYFSYRDVQPIKFKEITKATKNFHPDTFVGHGAFCEVFKAWIDEKTLTASEPGSGLAVAVNKWNPIGRERHQNWVKKISRLTELRHPNLVELVGYCSEKDNMILVHEFMPEGSLDNHLFKIRDQSLPWATRIKVALDVARGLSFLHDKETPVIHRDFKTANIHLNGEFNAKLSNYWFGRNDPTSNMTHLSADQVLVTYGYTAPEYAKTGQLTTKFNVYTFGVVLLELLSGLRAFHIKRPLKKQFLVLWAKPYLGNKRKLSQIMDTRLDGQYSRNAAYRIARLALRCLRVDPESRPRMAEVVVALEKL